jgi:hypothetical protein
MRRIIIHGDLRFCVLFSEDPAGLRRVSEAGLLKKPVP